jgi:hypothetical protein
MAKAALLGGKAAGTPVETDYFTLTGFTETSLTFRWPARPNAGGPGIKRRVSDHVSAPNDGFEETAR